MESFGFGALKFRQCFLFSSIKIWCHVTVSELLFYGSEFIIVCVAGVYLLNFLLIYLLSHLFLFDNIFQNCFHSFLGNIKDYFGETVGMYFAFLDFYTSALVVPAVVGVVFYLFEFHKNSISSLMILASFNLIWSTAFLESWKRRANALAYSWGTTDIKIIGKIKYTQPITIIIGK